MPALLCSHCGTPNRTGSNFCNRCGADLRGEPQPRDEAAPGDAAPDAASPDATPSLRTEQPWLAPGFTGADDVPFEEDEEDAAALDALPPLPAPAMRLVSGVQGLLDPIRVAAMPQDKDVPAQPPSAQEFPFGVEQMRRVRTLMMEEPTLASGSVAPRQPHRSLWLPWIFLILGVGVAAPLLIGWPLPAGKPMLWRGVASGFDAVDRLAPNARVQILWAYDPATAGEMDLLSAPVLRHLLDRGATLRIVSLLPNGPATARRSLANVEMQRLPDLSAIGMHHAFEVSFWPGGATVLPLLASESADLAVLFAAQSEDVQHWLEQVAPINRVPVVAVTSAGADPPLRAYLDSGQLVGLVSGYDGAYHYTELLGETPAPDDVRAMRSQVAGQDYGALAILAIIVLGNLIALLTGRRHDG
ncbi:MAG: zinc ribbon domain-containing protein [Caldilinea sp.]